MQLAPLLEHWTRVQLVIDSPGGQMHFPPAQLKPGRQGDPHSPQWLHNAPKSIFVSVQGDGWVSLLPGFNIYASAADLVHTPEGQEPWEW